MRKLFLTGLSVLFLTFGAFAQTTEFDSGTKSANNGDFKTALVHYQRASANLQLSTKQSAQIHYNIGVCFYRLNQPNDAIAEFEQAIKLLPDYEKPHYALAMALVDLKEFEKAKSEFFKAIYLNETNGETWFDLALVLIQVQKFDEAAIAFRNAVKFKSIAKNEAIANLEILSRKETKSTAELTFKERK